jgi:hypothetical protein
MDQDFDLDVRVSDKSPAVSGAPAQSPGFFSIGSTCYTCYTCG